MCVSSSIAKKLAISSIEAMEDVGKILAYVANVLLFVLVTIIFLPAFLIVNYLQATWAKMLGDLFKY